MPDAGEKDKLLADPHCRSGYEYARERGELWRAETAEVLRAMAEAYMELFRQKGNRNSLGIALYLQELAERDAGDAGK